MSLNKIPALQEFIRSIQSIPFISSRNTYRLAEFFLQKEKDEFFEFFENICRIRSLLEKCENCCCWKEISEPCIWCEDDRENDKICIFETWIDALVFERSGIYKGLYHVLGGAISPLDGITPDLLNFEKLIKRIEKLENKKFEIIIGTSQSPEGEATASYLEKLLKNKLSNRGNFSITYLATGIPVGTSFEFIDRITLTKSFLYRRRLE